MQEEKNGIRYRDRARWKTVADREAEEAIRRSDLVGGLYGDVELVRAYFPEKRNI